MMMLSDDEQTCPSLSLFFFFNERMPSEKFVLVHFMLNL